MNKVQSARKGLFGVEPNPGIDELLRAARPSFEQIRDDRRLKVALKRAVNREKAPRWLVDSIRDSVRG